MLLLIGGCLDPALAPYRDLINKNDKLILTALVARLREEGIGYELIGSPEALPEGTEDAFRIICGTETDNINNANLTFVEKSFDTVICLSGMKITTWSGLTLGNAVKNCFTLQTVIDGNISGIPQIEDYLFNGLWAVRSLIDPFFFTLLRALSPNGQGVTEIFGINELIDHIIASLPQKQVRLNWTTRGPEENELLDEAINKLYGAYSNFSKYFSITCENPHSKPAPQPTSWHTMYPNRRVQIYRFNHKIPANQHMDASDFTEPHLLHNLRYISLNPSFKICVHFHSNHNNLMTPLIFPFYGDKSTVKCDIKGAWLVPARIDFKRHKAAFVFEPGHGYYILGANIDSIMEAIESQFQPVPEMNPRIHSEWLAKKDCVQDYWKFIGNEPCDILFYKPNTDRLAMFCRDCIVNKPDLFYLGERDNSGKLYKDFHTPGRKYDKIVLQSSYNYLPINAQNDPEFLTYLHSMLKKNGKIIFDAAIYNSSVRCKFFSRSMTLSATKDRVEKTISESIIHSNALGGNSLKRCGSEQIVSPWHPFTSALKVSLDGLNFEPRIQVVQPKTFEAAEMYLYCITKSR